MDRTYYDALAGCDLTIQDAHVFAVESSQGDEPSCTTLFFPGCALINFGLSVTDRVYDDLEQRGIVDGISLFCCGKILAFEDETGAIRREHEQRLARVIANSDIKRIVAACPNCVAELRALLASNENTSVEVAALPQILSDEGFRINHDEVAEILTEDSETSSPRDFRVAVHDPCMDRSEGIFAKSVRCLFPNDTLVELEHSRENSKCCGSLARAAGRPDVMESQARERGAEGTKACADALITSCMSCSNILGRFQNSLPVHHYLEFLYGERIDWASSPAYMEFRILFEEFQGKRTYQGATIA